VISWSSTKSTLMLLFMSSYLVNLMLPDGQFSGGSPYHQHYLITHA
jgi:hypothetical protein